MELTYRGDIQFVERDDAAKRAVVDAQAKEIKGRGAAKTQVTMTGSSVDGSSPSMRAENFHPKIRRMMNITPWMKIRQASGGPSLAGRVVVSWSLTVAPDGVRS